MSDIFVGIDVGSISSKIVAIDESGKILFKDYRRTLGRPAEVADAQMQSLRGRFSGRSNPVSEGDCFVVRLWRTPRNDTQFNIVSTGSGAKLLPYKAINEFKAIALSVGAMYPDVRTIFEMGGESSKFIRVEKQIPPNPPFSKGREEQCAPLCKGGEGGFASVVIVEYGVNGDCAAGTGSFIDQQANRLHYKVEEIGKMVSCAGRCAQIAGRCSVFAKSDMIHAQQKGFAPPEVMKGLCLAVARNFKASIVKGRRVVPKVAFVGGLAKNEGVISALKDVFELNELIIPENAEFMGAIGAALLARSSLVVGRQPLVVKPTANNQQPTTTIMPLSTANVRFLRDKIKPYKFPSNLFSSKVKGQGSKERGFVNAYLGIDIGSVSTNLVVIDEEGSMITEIYTYTKARPIEVVANGLKEIKEAIGEKVEILGVGTTGSGRELIGELIGADVIKDEITAHKTGALHICKKLTGETVDTIFEIGGQDAKFIRIEDGVVTDFAMNEACAAGTGSFLEEQAEKLGIKIKEEFARMALSSKAPLALGERCTVFMEKDVNAHQLNGAKIEDIVAGLANSVATNYLNRVVRGRKIGNHIFFQGGTAYNDAVASAFSQILSKTITVPPHNGVIGAIGAALLASKWSVVSGQWSGKSTTKFRGFDLGQVKYTMREFSCGACSNNCDIQEFNVEGEKTYWGDKCSSRFRKKARTDNKPVIEDMFKLREELLIRSSLVVSRLSLAVKPTANGQRPTTLQTNDQRPTTVVGIPRSMFYFDRFPFWRAYFETLGCEVIVSDATNKEITHASSEFAIAEPCFPIKLAHGHVKNLTDKKADYIFLPNVISAEKQSSVVSRRSLVKPTTNDQRPTTIPYLCPWHQTLPFVVRTVSAFEDVKFISPAVQFELGKKFVAKNLESVAKILGKSAHDNKKAVKAAYSAQRTFGKKLRSAGKIALETLKYENAPGIVLVGRAYNIYDAGANLNVGAKLRDHYGCNVIPLDFLPLDEVDITDVTANMFWDYGRLIISAAKIVAENPNLHMIYITNFKCGPDSFIKHYASWCAKKPYLTLQFDEHANDAGMITRLEAYLDSKGLLKINSKSETLNSKQIINSKLKMQKNSSLERLSFEI